MGCDTQTRQPIPEENREMERHKVTSSVVRSVGYDETAQTLEVEFNSGVVYQYDNVAQIVYQQLLAAESIGKFINAEIKPHFPYSRVRSRW